MELNYEIYQIQESTKEEGKPYRLFEELEDDVKEINLDEQNYKKVFTGKLLPNGKRRFNAKLALEYLFEVFNLNNPREFTGRSLSVSDIVKIQGKYYHCQRIGWKEINIVNS